MAVEARTTSFSSKTYLLASSAGKKNAGSTAKVKAKTHSPDPTEQNSPFVVVKSKLSHFTTINPHDDDDA